MYRLTQLREGTRGAIERGVMDSYGHTHEPEQRAVLYVVEQLLGYLPGIHRDYEQFLAILQQDEAVANAPVYGDDVLSNLTSEL